MQVFLFYGYHKKMSMLANTNMDIFKLKFRTNFVLKWQEIQ
jgi:hypothetical protein